MRPKVSVCIPAFNAEKFIARAIESALGQEFSDLEIIVSDNASTDATARIAGSFRDPRLRVFTNPTNIGFVRNLNACARRAGGDYVVFLCADDYWKPRFLARAVEVLERNPGADFAFSGAELTGERGTRPIPYAWPTGLIRGADFFGAFFTTGGVLLSSCLCRRTALAACGGFDETLDYSPDAAMWLRLALRGDAYFVPEVLAGYRTHAENLTLDFYRNGDMLRQKVELVRRVRSYPEFAGREDAGAGLEPAFAPLYKQLALDMLRMRVHGAARADVARGFRMMREAGAVGRPLLDRLALAGAYLVPRPILVGAYGVLKSRGL